MGRESGVFFSDLVNEVRSEIKKIPKTESLLICLSGDLGVGKTTFVQELMASYGYSPSQVLSPTFLKIIEHRVPNLGLVLHMDFYRIEEDREIRRLDLESYDNVSLWIAEWPQIFLEYLKNYPELLGQSGISKIMMIEFQLASVATATRKVAWKLQSAEEFFAR